MTKILLATKNQDKVKLLSAMLENVIPNREFHFYSLADFNISQDVEESGNIEERAKQKTSFYTGIVNQKQIPVDMVLGVDDGIEIDKTGERTAETKKMVDKILNENLLEIGDTVKIIRAYCFIKSADNSEFSITTEIPFKYIGNEKQISRIEGRYPLSYLLSHIDKDKAIVDTSQEEVREYDIKYSSALKDLF